MQLALKKLFNGEQSRTDFDYSLDLRATEWNGVKPFSSEVQVHGVVCSNAEGVRLIADAEFDSAIPCDRCAELIESRNRYHFEHELVKELHNEDSEEYILVEGDSLELDELMRTDILLELPTKNLCRSDCKGLCPKCGVNLNVQSCSCSTKQIDPRLEVLKQLLESE